MRLGLVLNYCVFLDDIVKQRDLAHAMAARSIEEAKAEGKLLIATVGATWCPWCAALQRAMPGPEFFGRLARVFVPKTDVLEMLGGERGAGRADARPG